MATMIEIPSYYPKNVTELLMMGTTSFIGLVDETTILKYPLWQFDEKAHTGLKREARMYQMIGPHKHVIGFKGLTESGLLLERASLGSVSTYLKDNDPALQQRHIWAYQATEAIVAAHKNYILHRDISVHNFLLDSALNLKLSDFQGRILAPNGDTIDEGLAVECTKSSLPRADFNYADWKTEIFALGSAFYYIMEGHQPYPELDSDNDEDEIVERFVSGRFCATKCPLMNPIIHKCWAGGFDSAEAVLHDLAFVHQDTAAEPPEEAMHQREFR